MKLNGLAAQIATRWTVKGRYVYCGEHVVAAFRSEADAAILGDLVAEIKEDIDIKSRNAIKSKY